MNEFKAYFYNRIWKNQTTQKKQMTRSHILSNINLLIYSFLCISAIKFNFWTKTYKNLFYNGNRKQFSLKQVLSLRNVEKRYYFQCKDLEPIINSIVETYKIKALELRRKKKNKIEVKWNHSSFFFE